MKALLKTYWPQLTAAISSIKADPTVPPNVIATGQAFYDALKTWMES